MYQSEHFNVGTVVITQGIHFHLKTNKDFTMELHTALNRYCCMDWGTLSENDIAVNKESLKNPDDIYLMGVYPTCKGKIWIITNRATEIPGDNVTTVCFPDER